VTIVPAVLVDPSQSEVEPEGAAGGLLAHSMEHSAAIVLSTVSEYCHTNPSPWTHCFVVLLDLINQPLDPRSEQLFTLQ